MEPSGGDITLSERERQAFLELELGLRSSDPRFADRLGGEGPAGRLPWWTAPLLLVLGSCIMVLSFTASLVIALAGALLAAAGLGLGAHLLAPRVAARVSGAGHDGSAGG